MSHRTFDDPNSIEARQALLDNRCQNSAGKRHRVKGRRVRLSAKKKAKVKHLNAMRVAQIERYHLAVRAYWTGAAQHHPGY